LQKVVFKYDIRQPFLQCFKLFKHRDERKHRDKRKHTSGHVNDQPNPACYDQVIKKANQNQPFMILAVLRRIERITS